MVRREKQTLQDWTAEEYSTVRKRKTTRGEQAVATMQKATTILIIHSSPTNKGKGQTMYDIEQGSRYSRNVNAEILEQHNDRLIDEMGNLVAELLVISKDIHREVTSQNDELERMNDGFGDLHDRLDDSTKRVQSMLTPSGAGGKNMTSMVAFCVSAVCFLWFLI